VARLLSQINEAWIASLWNGTSPLFCPQSEVLAQVWEAKARLPASGTNDVTPMKTPMKVDVGALRRVMVSVLSFCGETSDGLSISAGIQHLRWRETNGSTASLDAASASESGGARGRSAEMSRNETGCSSGPIGTCRNEARLGFGERAGDVHDEGRLGPRQAMLRPA
jgi:hypothetical protein